MMGYAPCITLTVGSTTVLARRAIGSGDPSVRVERIISIPYRAGEDIALTLEARGANMLTATGCYPSPVSSEVESGCKASISAKIKLVRFGRK